MERRVGDIIIYNGKTYQAEYGITCKDCAFLTECSENTQTKIIFDNFGYCNSMHRSEGDNIVFKEIKGVEIKSNTLIIDVPKGMEIDTENSDLVKGIIKFKTKSITYNDVYNELNDTNITINTYFGNEIKLKALVKLMNIAKHYNGDWKPDWKHRDIKYYIYFDNNNNKYDVNFNDAFCRSIVYFKNSENARAVINNPNFKSILDTIYKN